MPTLDWIGKRAVLNHHREIAFHLLKQNAGLSAGDPEAGNLLVRGDNLLALKALLPYYAQQVKLIYIDPPYNTGNEGWVYNDAVNSPEMREWLGRVVGSEAEDLSRHDKWLCMMYPRLQLLKQFLHADGSIFVSMGDDSIGYLRLLMDEVFGPSSFVARIIWQKRYSRENRSVKAFVHGVTAAATGAIAGAAFVLGRRAVIDLPTVFIACATLALLFLPKRVPEPALILAAGMTGIVLNGAAPVGAH